MSTTRYQWKKYLETVKKIFAPGNSHSKVMEGLKEFFEQMQAKKEISNKRTFLEFSHYAITHARLKGFLREEHKIRTPSASWTEAKKEAFIEAIGRKKTRLEILRLFPEFKSESAVGYAIRLLIGDLDKVRKLQIKYLSPDEKAEAKNAAKKFWEQRKQTDEEKKRKKEIQEVEKQLDKVLPVLVKKRRIRNRDAVELIGKDKNYSRGILRKGVEVGVLVEIPDSENYCSWYFSNTAGFYTHPINGEEELMDASELLLLVPQTEQNRIANLLAKSTDGITLEELCNQLYGRDEGQNFVESYLMNFLEKNLIELDEDLYSITHMGSEFGLDAQTIKSLDAVEIENQLLVTSEEKAADFKTLSDVSRALKKNRESLTVHPIDLSEEFKNKRSAKLLIGAELLFGNQDTADELLLWILENTTPDISIVSGLVQGTFSATHVKKARILAEEKKLNKIGPQISAAGRFLEELEKITKGHVGVVQGDDDFEIAENYANLAQLSEGKSWSFGVNTKNLSAELKRQLWIREGRNKHKIQWEIIIPYWYRLNRSLKNKREVENVIGVRKSEYRLIIEILIARRRGFNYPKDYEKVVDVPKLLGNTGKRIVTPDSLTYKIMSREIQFVHNTSFSDVTQYVDPLITVERIMRNLGARDLNLPWMLIDGHQEFFYGTYFQGHWVMTAPGMQDATLAARYKKKVFAYRVLGSKAHRQNTFRKSPATPGMIELEILSDIGPDGKERDGRIRFRLLNDMMKNVLEAEKNKPPERTSVGFLTDTQFGSITMQPELVIKYLDYVLYELRVDRLRINGDLIQGVLYPMFFSENRPIRLTSVDSQQRFANMILLPLIVNAPALRDFAAWQGNHEWGIWGNALTGENALYFLEAALQGVIYERSRVLGKPPLLQNAMTVSRISWFDPKKGITTNYPTGSNRVLFPMFVEKVAGFNVAYNHMWQPYGGGRTPVDQPRKWLSNMADAAGFIHMLVGGDKHSIWMAQEYGKFILQCAAAATQSGYELARGLMSTIMFTLFTFDNRSGITVEFIPWEFLMRTYECQSPTFKGKDEQLILPSDTSKEYDNMKYSPLVEQLLDATTRHLQFPYKLLPNNNHK